MTSLTKAELLAGKDLREVVPMPSRGGTVSVRPITYREWSKIAASRLRGMKVDGTVQNFRGGKVQMDMEQTTLNNYDSQVEAVHLALVDPEMTLEEVYEMTPGDVTRIAARVYEISGITEEAVKRITSFQSEP